MLSCHKVHQDVIQRVTSGIEAWGFKAQGVCESPIKGEKSGNTEFLSYFIRDPSVPVTTTAVMVSKDSISLDDGNAPIQFSVALDSESV